MAGNEGAFAAGGDSAAEDSGDIGDGRGEVGSARIRDFPQALKRNVCGGLMSELKLRTLKKKRASLKAAAT